MLDRGALDDFSRSFAEALFREFSAWEQHAESLIDRQCVPKGALHVSVPQPSGQHSLEIWTDEGEVTLGFALWHAHYGPYLGISDQDSFDMALADIRGILAEHLVVVVSHRATVWLGSTLEQAADLVGPSSADESKTVYSWLGSHDRVLRDRQSC